MADEGEEKRYRQLASSDGLELQETPRALTPMKQIESARAQWRKKEELRLEESWTSLNLFDRSQKGRISMDLESELTGALYLLLS